MKSYLSQVAEFHRAFRQHQPEPIIPTFDHATNTLRVELIREELRELANAISDNDRIQILDALCDIQYVLSGSVLAWGLRPLFENIKIVTGPRPIPDMERHFVMMFGLLPQMEVAADMEFGGQVLTHLQLLQSRLSRLVFHFGFERFSEAFAEVHANNCDKYWSYEEYVENECGENPDMLKIWQWEHVENKGYVAYREDGKVAKPPHHAKVDLTPFV